MNIDEAFIGDVGAFKSSNSIESAKQFKEISIIVSTEHWMSPEMRDEKNKIKLELLKSDIFSLGLIGLFRLDPNEFLKKQQKKGDFNESELLLVEYLEEFRKRVVP